MRLTRPSISAAAWLVRGFVGEPHARLGPLLTPHASTPDTLESTLGGARRRSPVPHFSLDWSLDWILEDEIEVSWGSG